MADEVDGTTGSVLASLAGRGLISDKQLAKLGTALKDAWDNPPPGPSIIGAVKGALDAFTAPLGNPTFGLRREDVSDDPEAARPDDPMIGRAHELTQAAMTGGIPMAEKGAVGMAGGGMKQPPLGDLRAEMAALLGEARAAPKGLPSPSGASGQIIKPAVDVAKMYSKDGDLAAALARADGAKEIWGRIPGYYEEVKNAIIKQASPKEIERVKRLELQQEQMGGDLYGGEPRGLVNWLRQYGSQENAQAAINGSSSTKGGASLGDILKLGGK